MAKKPVVAEFTAEIKKLAFTTQHDKSDGSPHFEGAIPLSATIDGDLYEVLGKLWRSGLVKVTIEQVQTELDL